MDNPSDISPVPDVSPGEAGNVSQEDKDASLLKEINESTGRDYKTLEEAKKGVKETYGYIGQMGEIKEKAKKWDENQANKSNKDVINDAYAPGGRIDKIEFNAKFSGIPENVVTEIASIAKSRNMTMAEVYENSPLKKFVDDERKSQEPTNPGFVTSGRLPEGQIGMSRDELSKLPLDEQRKFITKLPSWNKQIHNIGTEK